MALHRYPFQRLCLWLYPYCAKFSAVALLVKRLVTNVGDSGEDGKLFTRDDEETAFIRNSASDEGRVMWRKQGNIGVGYGLAVGVNNGALVSGGGFLWAFHDDFLLAGIWVL